MVSVTSVLWFWVASQTAQGRKKKNNKGLNYLCCLAVFFAKETDHNFKHKSNNSTRDFFLPQRSLYFEKRKPTNQKNHLNEHAPEYNTIEETTTISNFLIQKYFKQNTCLPLASPLWCNNSCFIHILLTCICFPPVNFIIHIHGKFFK